MKTHRKLQLIALVVFLAGLGAIAPFGYYKFRDQAVQAAGQTREAVVPAKAPLPSQSSTLITGKPVRIIIPSVQIDIVVADGAYDENTRKWTLSSDKAHYALPSSQPNNEQGNTLIYGHYRKEVFSRLRKMPVGAKVTIITDNDYKFTYTYKSTEAVNPADTSVFAYEGKPRLTLQTCSGAWMQNRQLYYFDFTKAEKL